MGLCDEGPFVVRYVVGFLLVGAVAERLEGNGAKVVTVVSLLGHLAQHRAMVQPPPASEDLVNPAGDMGGIGSCGGLGLSTTAGEGGHEWLGLLAVGG